MHQLISQAGTAVHKQLHGAKGLPLGSIYSWKAGVEAEIGEGEGKLQGRGARHKLMSRWEDTGAEDAACEVDNNTQQHPCLYLQIYMHVCVGVFAPLTPQLPNPP